LNNKIFIAILQAGKSGGFRKENRDGARNKVALGNVFNNNGRIFIRSWYFQINII